ncbi:isoprenoid synthase domain-containing protein [Tricladium varicosporioides]|nr:isoprenoid synthase domain-containing protein [Hymenoscyphus varicosporioides]
MTKQSYSSRSQPVHHSKPWQSLFSPRLHHLGDAVCEIDNAYLIDRWGFPSKAAEKFFVDMDLSRWSVLVLPEILNSRIQLVTRFLTVLFLIDDNMDYETGQEYVVNLKALVVGEKTSFTANDPNMIISEIINELDKFNHGKTNEVKTGVSQFWDFQVDRSRPSIKTLDDYLVFRVTETAMNVTHTLARLGMDLEIPAEEEHWLKKLEHITTYHIIIVNDLYSWDKELLQASNSKTTDIGGDLVSAITVVMKEENVDEMTAKKFLATKVHDLEVEYFDLVKEREKEGPMAIDARRYADCLPVMAAGNESWSRVTARYNVVNGKRMKPVEENLDFRAKFVNGYENRLRCRVKGLLKSWCCVP